MTTTTFANFGKEWIKKEFFSVIKIEQKRIGLYERRRKKWTTWKNFKYHSEHSTENRNKNLNNNEKVLPKFSSSLSFPFFFLWFNLKFKQQQQQKIESFIKINFESGCQVITHRKKLESVEN